MFARHGIYTETEIKSRQDINMEEYAKVIHIEALTSLDMLGKMIVPACAAYSQGCWRKALRRKRASA